MKTFLSLALVAAFFAASVSVFAAGKTPPRKKSGNVVFRSENRSLKDVSKPTAEKWQYHGRPPEVYTKDAQNKRAGDKNKSASTQDNNKPNWPLGR